MLFGSLLSFEARSTDDPVSGKMAAFFVNMYTDTCAYIYITKST